jgi:HEAT repeat protein
VVRVRTARHSTRGAWRILAPRVARQWRDLGLLALAAALWLWCLDRITRVGEGAVWGGDLYAWVGRLDATERSVRDSAIVAVGDLARRAWDDLASAGPSEATRSGSPRAEDVTAAVVALSSRLADPDSLLRQHVATALLDLTEGAERDGLGRSSHPMGTEPLRVVVREQATELLLQHLMVTPPRLRADAALEVLAALGAPPSGMPVLVELARTDESPSVRALALVVVARAAGSPTMPVPRVRSILQTAARDTSPEVREAASAALGEIDGRSGTR